MFLDIDSLSACASDANTAVSISPETLPVSMPSFSKYTLTPRAFRERTVSRHSVVLRANLDMDFTSILSMSPRSQSRSIRLKSSRFSIEVPVMPSSA